MNAQYAISSFASITGLESMIRALEYTSNSGHPLAQQSGTAEMIPDVEQFEHVSMVTRKTVSKAH